MEGKAVVDQQKECKIFAETEKKAKNVGVQNDIGSSQEEHKKLLQMRDLLEKHDPTSKVTFFFPHLKKTDHNQNVLDSKCYMTR